MSNQAPSSGKEKPLAHVNPIPRQKGTPQVASTDSPLFSNSRQLTGERGDASAMNQHIAETRIGVVRPIFQQLGDNRPLMLADVVRRPHEPEPAGAQPATRNNINTAPKIFVYHRVI